MIEFDHESILSKEFVLGTFQVTEDVVVAYAQAVVETSPQYVDPEAANSPAVTGSWLRRSSTMCSCRANAQPKSAIRKIFNAGQRCRLRSDPAWQRSR